MKAGAIGLKIFKNLGLTTRKSDGTRLTLDDPVMNPVWQACARLDIPVLIHTAEPMEFFSPMDYKNERWLELALFPSRRNNAPGQPSFEQLLGERDRMFAANPKTRYIGAHFAYYGHNLPGAAKLLDRLPNVVLEVSAVLYDFGRQPRASRRFFEKYQDRILFGTDAIPNGRQTPQQIFGDEVYRIYYRFLETEDEYFDYAPAPVPPQGRWRIYGIGLPDAILQKVYNGNARRLLSL